MPTSLSKQSKRTSAPPHGRKSTLSLQSASVAFAPARSLTSHARRLYVSRYQGRYRFSGWMFGFDVFLLGILAALVVFDLAVFLTTTLPKDGGVTLTFHAAPLRASEDIPVSVTVRAKDLAVHENVRLQWHLPDWVEIVRAEPSLAPDDSVYFGTVSPGDDRRSLIVVRIRAVKGVDVPFDITLHQTDRFGFHQTTIGRELRTVDSSAVSVQMPLPLTHAAMGASIPVEVRNAGKSALESAVLRITDGQATVAGGSSIFLGHLSPSSTRIVFIDVLSQSAGEKINLAWQLEDQARIVAASTVALTRLDEVYPLTILPTASAELERGLLRVPYDLLSGSIGKFLTVLEGAGTISSFSSTDAVVGSHSVDVAVPNSDAGAYTRWNIVPVVLRPDGGWWVSKRITRALTSAIPFSAAARYYSESGDQIGVGPITPDVGQETRYWVVWSVDSGAAGLKDVTLSGYLPPAVRATGNFASTVSGSLSVSGRNVTWTFPSLPPLSGQTPLTFAFEAVIKPTTFESVYPLIATSTIEAIDVTTGATLYTAVPGDDSRWMHDEKARGE